MTALGTANGTAGPGPAWHTEPIKDASGGSVAHHGAAPPAALSPRAGVSQWPSAVAGHSNPTTPGGPLSGTRPLWHWHGANLDPPAKVGGERPGGLGAGFRVRPPGFLQGGIVAFETAFTVTFNLRGVYRRGPSFRVGERQFCSGCS